jgi:glutaredoxin
MKRDIRAACLRALALAVLLCAAPWPALALYKVISPDGRITYTDRPPTDGSSKVVSMGSEKVNEFTPPDVLPLALRQTTSRCPVVLYTSAACSPCDTARHLLALRGVPYSEKLILSEDDAMALDRTIGGRAVPALTIGGQVLRGLSSADWHAYLDAAGYPRESLLPAGWQPVAAQPLVPRTVAPLPAPAEVAAPPVPRALPEAPAAPRGLRF